MLKLKRLKEIIDVERGLKRAWVAEKVGLTPGSFRLVMAGKNIVSKERAAVIAKLLKVKLDEIWSEK